MIKVRLSAARRYPRTATGRCHTGQVREIYPSWLATVLLLVSIPVLAVGFVVIFMGPPVTGELIGAIGATGVLGSAWVNHKRIGR